MNTSDLRTLLRDDFGQDFPISGGNGESCEAAIVIHRQRPNNYVAVEYGVLHCLAIRRGVEWQPLLQALLDVDGRKVDKMQIETRSMQGDQIITRTEAYFFDITECLG